MPADHTRPTRQRILTEAMRLFGEQGYAATTIAQIEKAAGLSPGSGSLYRHFRSKYALLTEGVQQQIASGQQLLSLLDDQTTLAHLPTRERLALLAQAGLDRLEQERDLNRLLVFGQHPAGIDQDRYIAALVELAAGLLDADQASHLHQQGAGMRHQHKHHPPPPLRATATKGA